IRSHSRRAAMRVTAPSSAAGSNGSPSAARSTSDSRARTAGDGDATAVGSGQSALGRNFRQPAKRRGHQAALSSRREAIVFHCLLPTAYCPLNMAYWNHRPAMLKRSGDGQRALPARRVDERTAEVFAAPYEFSRAGWWRDDHTEQLRNYQSWVYAAV